jgi:ribonuclease P protein component
MNNNLVAGLLPTTISAVQNSSDLHRALLLITQSRPYLTLSKTDQRHLAEVRDRLRRRIDRVEAHVQAELRVMDSVFSPDFNAPKK